MVVDQSPEGLEVLRGSSTYVYEGNWKVQVENGADGYHVSTVHWNYAATQQQRKLREAGDDIRAMSAVAGAGMAAVSTPLKTATRWSGHAGVTRKTARCSPSEIA